MNIDKKVSAKQGHPCTGCPYIFAGKKKGCIMGAVPGDCAWYFYKRLMGHSDAFRPVEEMQRMDHIRRKSECYDMPVLSNLSDGLQCDRVRAGADTRCESTHQSISTGTA